MLSPPIKQTVLLWNEGTRKGFFSLTASNCNVSSTEILRTLRGGHFQSCNDRADLIKAQKQMHH